MVFQTQARRSRGTPAETISNWMTISAASIKKRLENKIIEITPTRTNKSLTLGSIRCAHPRRSTYKSNAKLIATLSAC